MPRQAEVYPAPGSRPYIGRRSGTRSRSAEKRHRRPLATGARSHTAVARRAHHRASSTDARAERFSAHERRPAAATQREGNRQLSTAQRQQHQKQKRDGRSSSSSRRSIDRFCCRPATSVGRFTARCFCIDRHCICFNALRTRPRDVRCAT